LKVPFPLMSEPCQPCPVCTRDIDGYDSGMRSSVSGALEPKFCSRYCRLFHDRGLEKINGAEKYGKRQYEGFNWWPKIAVDCDKCGESFNLASQCDHNNQVFCTIKCANAVKTSKKKAMRDYQLLRILRTLGWENQVNEGWLSPDLIAKKLCQFNYTANSNTVAGVMRRWVSRGVVERKPGLYRIAPAYREKPLGHIVCQFNQRPVQTTFPKV